MIKLHACLGMAILLAQANSAADKKFAKPPEQPVNTRIEGHIFIPHSVEPTEQRLSKLSLPEGFKIRPFAKDLGEPRMLAVADNGDVYVTRRAPNEDVLLLRDADGDGTVDQQVTATELKQVHDIAIKEDLVYLVAVNKLYEGEIQEDGTFGELSVVLSDLPDGGQHPNRTIKFGPDDYLYLTVGSTCNACDETNDENATILKVDLEAKSREIFASGLRNTIGFDWHPETGNLYGVDHGIDWLGDDDQLEELNLIEDGAKYGWPYVFGKSEHNPADEPPAGTSRKQWAKESHEPVLLHEAHAAPMDLHFYTGDAFPEDYRNDAFVAFHGSWNRSEPSGYNLARVVFEDDQPLRFETFVGDFLEDGGKAQFGRPCGLAQTPTGDLLLSDDKHGVIYIISYEG
ncbi:PQQ-dependent sugar dehydrogenase [Pelagicoccus sp. SDUM812002]|uniref:PQQ-dependent sugar dehydrogenase n=1 Tax=Pelagicoccus sp. SDUM812002 TaxID=3041266 RepID=UPI00280DDA92|nr:PQQ-dependent sugar dehydrogenase [Pelagicoccus sp. SDUM812002]MDQ8184108.1 PQQ-dependent sugar dehydrogenase [Pelagicoccus sp. SDUM812002]